MNIEENISLKKFTTFKVGGLADYFCKVSNIDELKEAVIFSKENNLQVFILGHGSNVLISDDGFRGLVIKTELKGIAFERDKVIANAGESWDDVVKLAVKKELYGIENMSFIPGTVGAGIVGNIGAYGSEIRDVVECVEVFDIETLKTFNLSNDECEFEYRNSIFKKKNFIVTKVCLSLSKDGKLNTSYKDIKEYFGTKTPNIKAVRTAIGEIRSKKFPNLEKYGTAGSFFKNPIIEGNKVHLAKVLDELGMKGLREGDVALYKKQPLVVINFGDANANEIKKFTDSVAQKVFEKRKIKITPEIIFVGSFKH
ncbi:UDP-N-acetylmuramate dehydrogenase [bacterium]|nr:UDP-N-acetylmuramate dehydrogenase [bacterium]MBT3730107.1 UDP-N-acetylmuramate dehydrogenase [bacterium]MBT4894692.1 UDP-N-acetylmuramate dehydrogenase [bacterium]